MENSLNPPENQIPLDKQNPLEDPLLDALEQSIENPPGFVDPLAGDNQFMDELASQLDQVEASIENSPPLLPEPAVSSDEDELNARTDELETASPPEEQESFETMNELEGTIQNLPSFDSQDSDIDEHMFKQPMSKPKRRGGRTGLKRRSKYLFKRLTVKRAGSLISRRNSQPRFRPENHKLIDKQKCESCEKYRRWPKGTNEEPEKCWYDWQAKASGDKPDDGDE